MTEFDPEPTPWAMGSVCAVATAVLVATAVGALGAALTPVSVVFAVIIVTVVVTGPVPLLARRRREPVWRWLIHGAAAGAVLGVGIFAVDLLAG